VIFIICLSCLSRFLSIFNKVLIIKYPIIQPQIASTINRAGLGLKDIRKNDGSALSSGDITAGNAYLFSYSSANGYYVCETCGGSGGGGSGTVTSVSALTLGTTGTDLNSSVANPTTTPVITLNIPTASAANRGALSSTDWSTFNGKQSTGLSYLLASGGTATGTNTFAMGAFPFIMTTGVTTGTGATAGHQLVGNSLTTGNLFDVSSSSVSSGALGVFTSTSTVIDHTAGTNGLIEVLMSGENSTDNKTATGLYSKVTNTRTATLNTNIAAYLEASGGGTNLALRTLGSVFIANASGDTPTASTRLEVRGVNDAAGFIIRGANQSNALRMTLNGAGTFEVGDIGTLNLSVTGNTISFLETGSSRGQIFSTGSTTRIYAGSSTGTGTFQVRASSLSMNNSSATSFGSWAPTGLNVLSPGNATSTATQANSPFVTFTSGFWDGAAATSRYYGIRQVASTTVNLTGRLSFYENIATGSERETMSISTTGDLNAAILSGTTLTLGGGATASELRFLQPGGGSYVGLKAPSLAGNITFTLPPAFVVGGVPTDVAGDGVLTMVVPSGSGSTYYAPTTIDTPATDADFTAVVKSIKHLPAATLTANRTITIPTGADGDVIELHNNEAAYSWLLAGATVYLSDRTTTVTALLYNVPTLMQKINGLWIIKN